MFRDSDDVVVIVCFQWDVKAFPNGTCTIKNVKYSSQYFFAQAPAKSGTPIQGKAEEAFWKATSTDGGY
jgi:hypothetical protein